MTTLGAVQIYALARAGGWKDGNDAARATAIALAESGGRTDAVGDVALQDSKWGPSIGLWQVRSLKAQTGTGKERDASRLKDPRFNATAAHTIFVGQGWSAWSVFTNGSYLAFMDKANAARGTLPGEKLDNWDIAKGTIAGTADGVADATGGVLTGIDAIGHFFTRLGERGMWVRVLQVVGGGLVIAGGLAALGLDVIKPAVSAAAGATPLGAAAKVAAKATTPKTA